MKKILSMMASLVLAATMTACGGDDEPVNPETPTTPKQLEAPTLSVQDVTENSFTVTWGAVANAVAYSYTVNNGDAQTTTQTTLSLTDLEAETSYTVRVMALSGDATRYTNSTWASTSATTLAEKNDTPAYEGVREGYYHVPTYWDEETGAIYEYNTFEVKYYGGNTYYIANLLNYAFPWEAIYDNETRELSVTGNIVYENNAGEVVTENIFNKICEIYTPEESGVGLWLGCIPRSVDESNKESNGTDPFRMTVDHDGYLSKTLTILADMMYELKMAAGSTAESYQIQSIGDFVNYRSLILSNISIAQGEAPEQ